jgi:protein-disulfide isomerase
MENIQEVNKKRWFTKWWGIVIIIFSVLILMLIINFISLIYRYKKAIELGEIIVPNIIGQYSEIEGGNSNFEITVTRSELESGNNPSLGADNPIMTIVEFSDFNCPYCAFSYPAIKQFVLENDEKVKVIFKDLPLGDFDSALAANCAFEQNRFLDMHDKLFYYQENISDDVIMSIAESIRLDMDSFKNCYDTERYRDEIQGDLALGVRAGVEGTPTIFINGEKFAGVIPKSILEQVLYAIEYGE